MTINPGLEALMGKTQEVKDVLDDWADGIGTTTEIVVTLLSQAS